MINQVNSLFLAKSYNQHCKKGSCNLQPLSFKAQKPSNTDIFIAMPMGKESKKEKSEWTALNNIIKKITSPRGFKARRIDDIIIETAKSDGNQHISQEILKAIADSRMVIADLSEHNPNVYYEMGYAIGKGKKVLPIAKEGTELAFDVKDLNTIFYEDKDTDLKEKLGEILSAIRKNDKKSPNLIHIKQT